MAAGWGALSPGWGRFSRAARGMRQKGGDQRSGRGRLTTALRVMSQGQDRPPGPPDNVIYPGFCSGRRDVGWCPSFLKSASALSSPSILC